jgi:pimeloyl-ACP methyl ester carboxylesterase
VLLGAPALVPGMLFPTFMRMLLLPVVGGLIARLPPSRAGMRWTHTQMGHSPDVLESMLADAYWAWSLALMTHTATMASDVRGIHTLADGRGVRADVALTAEQLAAINVPTLLYWGDADTFGGEALARTIAQLMPNAALELVRAGHLPWLDDPVHAARSIMSFLQVSEASVDASAA